MPGGGLVPAAGAVGTLPLLVVLADGGGLAGGQIMGEQALVSLPTHALQVVPVDRWGQVWVLSFSQNHRGWKSLPAHRAAPSPEPSTATPRLGHSEPPRAAPATAPAPFSEHDFPEETCGSLSVLTPLVSRAPRGAGTPGSLRGRAQGRGQGWLGGHPPPPARHGPAPHGAWGRESGARGL